MDNFVYMISSVSQFTEEIRTFLVANIFNPLMGLGSNSLGLPALPVPPLLSIFVLSFSVFLVKKLAFLVRS